MENHNEKHQEVERVLEKMGFDLNSKGCEYLAEVVTLTICQDDKAVEAEK